MKSLSIKELYIILKDLVECGHGDKEFQLYYDSDCVYTVIPKGSRVLMFKNGVRFSDYEGIIKLPKERTVEGILEKLNEDENDE